ncbi:MAG: glutaminase [Vicingaceae bacterium]
MNYQSIIENIHQQIRQENHLGNLAAYIPELAEVDPDRFGIYLHTVEQDKFGCGNFEEQFSIQSIAKVLSLSLAIDLEGPSLWKRVGVEPSGTAFNSLVQLEVEKGIPRNPFINSGAIVVCDVLISHLKNAKAEFLAQIQKIAHNTGIKYNKEIAASEASNGYRNFALVNFLKSFGNINNDVEEVLDFYFSLCSIKMNCIELASTFLYLANYGRNPIDNGKIISVSNAKRINAIMGTCGFYDESGEFAYRVGLPGKSGVGGGIVAIHPGKFAIAVWSPKLNEKGNSYRGMKFLEQFTTDTESSIY